MMAQGALAEVASLQRRDLSGDLPAMRAIGVPELAEHLKGELTLDTAIERARIATRQYAKRQYTWLRGQLSAEWPREQRALNDSIINEIVTKLRQMLLTD
jgi:tRNA dimethylallyltransferase